MPLASRATQNRADRTADTASATPPAEATQPRVKRGQAAPPADPPTTNSGATQAAAEAPPAETAAAPAKPPRKPRVAAEKATLDVGSDPKAMRARQKAIEKEFKSLNRELLAAQREVTQKFKERRVALESEHRLISNKLSGLVFNG